MKDFNTQRIDTPGVIDRVSALFGNNPALIQGFNTFLPPDFSLLYSMDPNDPAPIRITTPSGTISRGINGRYPAESNGDSNPQEPIEMDDAINYVNKIKIRFIKLPEIYNNFIEILQTFQREQRPIQEVYLQISVLFRGAPDLLADFRRFLPEIEREHNNRYAQFQPPPQPQRQLSGFTDTTVQLPPVGNFVAKGYPQEQHAEYSEERTQVKQAQPQSEYEGEIVFFNKVKLFIGNAEVYNNFLKLINLFSSEVIDKATLIERAYDFIGNETALFVWFKTFVGYDTSIAKIDNISQRKQHLEYYLLQPCGPSYRKLPEEETKAPCLGRDEMCWEVLNDVWVGHPTWASEDSGFVAHRKNQYQEVLFKIEEERHEYDFYLEANVRTIQTLETIAKQILAMLPEEKEGFNLREGLHSTSQTIYRKVIRKVYGEEQGLKVIEAIQNSPIVAIPVVLSRLKLKDEEWKRAQREWNKVWREQEQRVYSKSLDYLGLSFRLTDKKYLSPKSLTTEIQALKTEESSKRRKGDANDFLVFPPQILDDVSDVSILADVVRLVASLLNSYSSYAPGDKQEISGFLVKFVTSFFKIQDFKRFNEYASNHNLSDTKRNAEQSLLPVAKKPKLEQQFPSPIDWYKIGVNRDVTIDLTLATKSQSIFGNSEIYVFVKLILVLYKRLVLVKHLSQDVTKDLKNRKDVAFAKSLHLVPHLSVHLEQLIGSDNVYEQLLVLIEKLIKGDVELSLFEDILRDVYRNKAYELFSIQRVLHHVVQCIKKMLVSDSKEGKLFDLYFRSVQDTSKETLQYLYQARGVLENEDLYLITFTDAKVGARFVGTDDVFNADSPEGWVRYVKAHLAYLDGLGHENVASPWIEVAGAVSSSGVATEPVGSNLLKVSYKV